jgi:hypothetical protein
MAAPGISAMPVLFAAKPVILPVMLVVMPVILPVMLIGMPVILTVMLSAVLFMFGAALAALSTGPAGPAVLAVDRTRPSGQATDGGAM